MLPGTRERDVLDEIEERRLAPLDVVEDNHEQRVFAAARSSDLRNAQAISSRADVAESLSPQGDELPAMAVSLWIGDVEKLLSALRRPASR